jgi:hypothetical protein
LTFALLAGKSIKEIWVNIRDGSMPSARDIYKKISADADALSDHRTKCEPLPDNVIQLADTLKIRK